MQSDKKIYYSNDKKVSDEVKEMLAKKKPEQLELPLDDPNDNVIEFPLKPGSPILQWYKANVERFKNPDFASADQLGPYLTQYYSEKQLSKMTEKDILKALDELLEAGVL